MAIDIFSVFLSLFPSVHVYTHAYVYVSICPVCFFSSHIYIYYLEFGYNMALISSVLITMCFFSQITIADGIVSLKLVKFLILHICNN